MKKRDPRRADRDEALARRKGRLARPSRLRRFNASIRDFYRIYTQDVRRADVERLFSKETREVYRFFARGIDSKTLRAVPWYKRPLAYARALFLAFALRMSPARRVLYGLALVGMIIGVLDTAGLAGPHQNDRWLLFSLLVLNFLLALELADKLTLKGDLEVAREIQFTLLPRGSIARGRLDAYGVTRPANTVGGDFYDVIDLGNGRIGVAIGDVAGKGSPAALLMALLLSSLRALAPDGLAPASLITRLNRFIGSQAPPGRFISLFYADLDPASGSMIYVNAGHNPPILSGPSGTRRLTTGGIVLGPFPESSYWAQTVDLLPGDTLVLFSDGVTEAENSAGDPFDDWRLSALVERSTGAPAERLASQVIEAVEQFAGSALFADDLTVLVLRLQPIAAPAATA